MTGSLRIGAVAVMTVLACGGPVWAAPPQGAGADPDTGAAAARTGISGHEPAPSGRSSRHGAPAPGVPAAAASAAAHPAKASTASLADFPFRYLGMFGAGAEGPLPILVRGSRWLLAQPGQDLDGIARVETVSRDGIQVLFFASGERRFIPFAQIAMRPEGTGAASPADAAGQARSWPDHRPSGVPAAAGAAPAHSSGEEALRTLMGMEHPDPGVSIDTLMGFQSAPPSPETGAAPTGTPAGARAP